MPEIVGIGWFLLCVLAIAWAVSVEIRLRKRKDSPTVALTIDGQSVEPGNQTGTRRIRQPRSPILRALEAEEKEYLAEARDLLDRSR